MQISSTDERKKQKKGHQNLQPRTRSPKMTDLEEKFQIPGFSGNFELLKLVGVPPWDFWKLLTVTGHSKGYLSLGNPDPNPNHNPNPNLIQTLKQNPNPNLIITLEHSL